MAWIDTNWQQDDDINHGFPYPVGASAPIAFDLTAVYTPWKFSPYINDGFPYIVEINVKEPVPMPAIHEPLIVYASNEHSFTSNGLRILQPLSCITEEGESWDAVITHPIDADGDWTALQTKNIVKIPCWRRGKLHPQLFRIYRAVTAMSSNGEQRRTAYLRHIFYDLNDAWMEEATLTDLPGTEAINHVLKGFDLVPGVNPGVWFTAYSDITEQRSITYGGSTITAALIGTDNSFIHRWGGELYRDNYYFSICKRRENSLDHAFAITYSVEMTELEEDINYSDYATYVMASDNFGHSAVRYLLELSALRPHHAVRKVQFNYTSQEEADSAFELDFENYFASVSMPLISYRVCLADLAHTQLYKDFLALEAYDVGDMGTVYHELLDISTTQKIISKRTDALTGKVLEIRLGNLPGSITRKRPYSNTISTGQTAAEKRLAATQSQLDALSLEMIVTHPIATENGKWLITSAGKFIMWKGGT